MEQYLWLPTLYTFDNKDILRSYRIGHTTGGNVKTITGIVYKADGKPGKPLETKPKYIKPNTRSPTASMAAEVYAAQEWRKKQRKDKYRSCDHIPTKADKDAWDSEDTRVWPAVCLDWGKAKDADKVCSEEKPFYGQEKIDGDRMGAQLLEDGSVYLYSRNCLEIKFRDKIRRASVTVFEALKNEFGLSDVCLDGEALVPKFKHHQQSRSVSARSVNRHKDEDSLVFHIFDIVEYTMPFSERTKIVARLKELLPNLECIQFVTSTALRSQEEIVDFVQACDKAGYEEGIVLRRPDLLYTKKMEYKHGAMLKLKNFTDAEFEVVDFKAAEGTRDGCVVWQCCDPKNPDKTFWCTPTGTLEETRDYYDNAEDYIGRLYTVKYLTLTEDGLPFLPIGLRFRDESDLPAEH